MLDLDLAGMWNLRDLALTPTALGPLGPGRLLRGDAPHRLDHRAWRSLFDRGVRVVIDLRNPEESEQEPTRAPEFMRSISCALEAELHGTELFEGWFRSGVIGTPLYYAEFTRRWPGRVLAALDAIASANGGALVHCAKGCDRTGMIVALALESLGVAREHTRRDYMHTRARIATDAARALGRRDDTQEIDAVVAAANTTLTEALDAFLDGPWRAHLGPALDETTARLGAWASG